MKLSYIIPHKNRTDLFVENLRSLVAQTNKNFEVIVVDGSDEAYTTILRDMVQSFRGEGLEIKAIRVDPTTHPLAHPPGDFSGQYNPALAQNIGVRKATGDIICLTSPEVINACTNVDRALALFSDNQSRFVLGWIDERWRHEMIGTITPLTVERIKSLCLNPNINGAMCRDDVKSRPWLPSNYFLGFMRRDDFIRIGGVDERFMGSVAYEDNFFAHCCEHAGFEAQLKPDIAGIHLTHSRGYQSSQRNTNAELWASIKNSEFVANAGRAWGEYKYIVEEF